MTSVELRKLNAYPEWRDDNMIDAVTQYVQAIQNNNPNAPINQQLYPTQRKRQRFIQKFQQGFRVLNINLTWNVLSENQGTGRALKYVGKSILGSLGWRITPKEERAKIKTIITTKRLLLAFY